MARRKAPVIPDALLDQLLAGRDPQAALGKDGLIEELKRALAERALNADHPRRFRLAQPLLQDQHQRPPPQLLLRRSPNAAKVPLLYALSIAGCKPLVRYIHGILVFTVSAER